MKQLSREAMERLEEIYRELKGLSQTGSITLVTAHQEPPQGYRPPPPRSEVDIIFVDYIDLLRL